MYVLEFSPFSLNLLNPMLSMIIVAAMEGYKSSENTFEFEIFLKLATFPFHCLKQQSTQLHAIQFLQRSY